MRKSPLLQIARTRQGTTLFHFTVLVAALALALPARAAGQQLTAVSPSEVEQQTTEDVEIAGTLTSFLQGKTSVSFGDGITVNSVTVVNPTVLIANITVAVTALTGPRDISVTVAGSTLTLKGKFSVISSGPSNPPNKPNRPAKGAIYNIEMALSAACWGKNEDIILTNWYLTGQLQVSPNPNPTMTTTNDYVAAIIPSSNLSVNVIKWTMKAPDGTEAKLVSATTFNAPMGTPTLILQTSTPDLPASNGTITIPFSTNQPQETIEVKGHNAQMSWFGGVLGTLLTTNVITLPQIQAFTGNTSNSTSPSPSNSASGSSPPAPAIPPALQQAMTSIQAHKGDTAWLMSPEGQATLAATEQQALAMVSIPASQAASVGQAIQTFHSLVLPWKAGTGRQLKLAAFPVNQNLKFETDDFRITLQVLIYLDIADGPFGPP